MVKNNGYLKTTKPQISGLQGVTDSLHPQENRETRKAGGDSPERTSPGRLDSTSSDVDTLRPQNEAIRTVPANQGRFRVGGEIRHTLPRNQARHSQLTRSQYEWIKASPTKGSERGRGLDSCVPVGLMVGFVILESGFVVEPRGSQGGTRRPGAHTKHPEGER